MKHTPKTTKKPARKPTTKPVTKAKRTAAEKPIPYATTREPLTPITGDILPPILVAGLDSGRPIEQVAAERVALVGDHEGGGEWRASLGTLLRKAYDVTASQPFAAGCLGQLRNEILVIARTLDDGDALTDTLYAMADRAEVALELDHRIARATFESNKPVAPDAREVAARVLMLPGVLSSASAWDRLLRIAERLDVYVVDSGPFHEFWYREDGVDQRTFYSVLPRGEGEPSGPCIMLKPNETDREGALAHMLGYAVARREGYGEVSDEWRNEFAAVLLDRAAKKGAAA